MATLLVGKTGTPNSYSDMNAAMNVAKDGDVILMEPGVYTYNADWYLRRCVTIRNHADDPVANPVQIRHSSSYASDGAWGNDYYRKGRHMDIRLDPMVSGEMIFEGIYFRKYINHTNSYDIYPWFGGASFKSNAYLLFNRCQFDTYASSGMSSDYYNRGYSWLGYFKEGTVELRNCKIMSHHNSREILSFNNDCKLHLVKCEVFGEHGDLNFHSCETGFDYETNDKVLTPTEGYGWGYGEYVREIEECVFRGIVEDDGTPAAAEVRVYSDEDGSLHAYGDTDESGNFEFDMWGHVGHEFSIFVRPPVGEPIVISKIVPQDPNPDYEPPGNYGIFDGRWHNTDTYITDEFQRVYTTATTWRSARGTVPLDEGKWYWEVEVQKVIVSTTNYMFVGVVNNRDSYDDYPGQTGRGSIGYYSSGNMYGSTTNNGYGNAWKTVGDVVGVAVDIDNRKIWFRMNGVWQGYEEPGDPIAGTQVANVLYYAGINLDRMAYMDDIVYPAVGFYTEGNELVLHTDPLSFRDPAPAGFDPYPRTKTPKVFTHCHGGKTGQTTGGVYNVGEDQMTSGNISQSNIVSLAGTVNYYYPTRWQRSRIEANDVGKYYWEIQTYNPRSGTGEQGQYIWFGMGEDNMNWSGNSWIGSYIGSWSIRGNSTLYDFNRAGGSRVDTLNYIPDFMGPSGVLGILNFAYNAATGSVWLGVDGVWVGDPEAGTDPAVTGFSPDRPCYFAISRSQSTFYLITNFGDQPFQNTVPGGYTGYPKNNYHIE